MGDFNADPTEPAYARIVGCRVPFGLRRGQRQGTRGHLAVRPPGTGHRHRRRPEVPRLHLGPRADPRHRCADSCSTVPTPTTPDSSQAIISGSLLISRSGRNGRRRAEAAVTLGASRRLARTVPRTRVAAFTAALAVSRLRRARIRRPRRRGRCARRHPRCDADARPAASRSRRCDDRGGARRSRSPDAERRPRGSRVGAVPRRRAQGRRRATSR